MVLTVIPSSRAAWAAIWPGVLSSSAGKGDVKTNKKIMAFSGRKMENLSVKNSDTDSEILSKLKYFIELRH
jgi:hypothetical protein